MVLQSEGNAAKRLQNPLHVESNTRRFLVMSLEGIHDVYLAEGTVNGEKFEEFVRTTLLSILQPFNWINPHSVVIIDNAAIHHVQGVINLIEKPSRCQVDLPSSLLTLSESYRGSLQPSKEHNEAE